MFPRRALRRLVALSCLAASGLCLAGCSPQTPAASADQAATVAAEGAVNESPADGRLHSHFAGVMPRGLTTVGAATLGDALYLVGGYFGSPHDYSKEFQSGSVRRLSLPYRCRRVPRNRPGRRCTRTVRTTKNRLPRRSVATSDRLAGCERPREAECIGLGSSQG